MGIKRNSHSVADALFSKVQQRVLALLFGQPDRSFYASELIRLAASGTGAVQRELGRLAASGIVKVTRVGNQKHYRANREAPIFEELRSLILKTVGLVKPLQDALARYSKKIRAAFIYGSVAKRRDTAKSDIDVLIVTNELTYREIFSAIQRAEAVLGRTINPNLFTVHDWKRKLAAGNPFVTKINLQPKMFIVGSENDLV